MVYVNPNGRDWTSVVNWDALGQTYAVIAIVWTVVLGLGMAWLVMHRELYFLKMRNILLGVGSTIFFHLYLLKILLAYTVNGNFPCGLEFWVMSIYLPFGIALFQASSAQLLSVSGQQQKLLEGQPFLALEAVPVQVHAGGLRGLWTRWRAMTTARQTEILIGVGMGSQVIVTLAIYLADRKFHDSWGITGPLNGESAVDCRRGWEWIPSIIWQFFWAWLYGPYILYRIRNINDVHYWRAQTTLCVLAGLPGTPLWLAALYSPSFQVINRHWVTPLWLAPGIIMMQTATVFFPIYEAYRARAQLRKTLATVDSWDEKRQKADSESRYSGSTKGNVSISAQTTSTNTTGSSGRRREMYSMAALEKALDKNRTPLLHFAASKEFTGENIIFLVQVRDWRAAWHRAVEDYGAVEGHVRYSLFTMAVNIFATSIHIKTADFPVNVEGKIRSRLETIFGPATLKSQKRDENVVDPFNRYSVGSFRLKPMQSLPSRTDFEVEGSGDGRPKHAASQSQESILPSAGQESDHEKAPPIPDVLKPLADIPADFDESIFDEAEQSIKYMVVTNTWPKFVDWNKETSGDNVRNFMI